MATGKKLKNQEFNKFYFYHLIILNVTRRLVYAILIHMSLPQCIMTIIHYIFMLIELLIII